MAIPLPEIDDSGGNRPSDSVAAAGVILPAPAYAEPEFNDFALSAAGWTHIASRDIGRAAVVITVTDLTIQHYVRSGNNPVAAPIIMGVGDPVMVLRYIDFLTVVTGDLWMMADAPTHVTVGSIRLN